MSIVSSLKDYQKKIIAAAEKRAFEMRLKQEGMLWLRNEVFRQVLARGFATHEEALRSASEYGWRPPILYWLEQDPGSIRISMQDFFGTLYRDVIAANPDLVVPSLFEEGGES